LQYCYYLVKDTTNQQMKVLWKWNSNEIVSQYTKMVFVAHLKYKMMFTYRNFKFKIPLNCTDGTTFKYSYSCFKLDKLLGKKYTVDDVDYFWSS
jgi:hypothetical protein